MVRRNASMHGLTDRHAEMGRRGTLMASHELVALHSTAMLHIPTALVRTLLQCCTPLLHWCAPCCNVAHPYCTARSGTLMASDTLVASAGLRSLKRTSYLGAYYLHIVIGQLSAIGCKDQNRWTDRCSSNMDG